MRDRDSDCICAIATPHGVGGISVVRVSGSRSFDIVRSIARFLPKEPESHRVYYGFLKSLSPQSIDDVIDEVTISFFRQGRSFTGEDTFEISCHGSPHITKRILDELCFAGARTAERGEFSYRAFMNGRIDLVQAESILSLIQAQSDISAKQALRQLGGRLSQNLISIEDELTWCLAHLEAGIDFSTEDIEIVTDSELGARFKLVLQQLRTLVQGYNTGRVIKDGIRLALAGLPNAGKSSLLNMLVGEDRSIVTDIPGTTRDTIEAAFFVGGIKILTVDTAGLRSSLDFVERIGIDRAYSAIESSEFVFYLFDLDKGLSPQDLDEIGQINTEKLFLLGSKHDLVNSTDSSLNQSIFRNLSKLEIFQSPEFLNAFLEKRVHFFSVKDINSIERLKAVLISNLELGRLEDSSFVSQVRHFQNLMRAIGNLQNAQKMLVDGFSGEFLALEMKEALIAIQETLGKRYDDEILDRVFKEFCIGK